MKQIGEKVISAIRVIVTVLLWAAALAYLYSFLFKDYAMRNRTLLLLLLLTIVSLVIVILILTWRAYNVRRFGKLDRRKFTSPVTSEEIGSLFGLSNISVEALKTPSSLTLAVTRLHYIGNGMEYQVLTISAERARYRVNRPAVTQDFSAYTRVGDGSV